MKPRVLIVDDDLLLLDLIERNLEQRFEVKTLHDPLRAVEAVQTQRFDVYLYDVCMDPLPGVELLLMTLSTAGQAPVVLMTGEPTIERTVEALRAGATDLLLKPFDFAALPDTLLRAMDKARKRPGGAPQRVGEVQEALCRAVEAKDPTTSGHGERVRWLSHLVAEALGLSKGDQEVLDRAGALHDIGKIGVPDAVLTKPASLTPQEFAMIQPHPEVGARILEPIPGLEPVRRCVLEHHERWDGTGYPRRLRAEEVSLPGRVLILAEVFDALAHPRSYKPAWPKDAIAKFFHAGSGSHFDPQLTDCFLGLVQRDFNALLCPKSQERGMASAAVARG